MFTKKHYKILAELIGKAEDLEDLQKQLIRVLQVDNVKFNINRFITAIENTHSNLKLEKERIPQDEKCMWSFSESSEAYPIILCCHGIPEDRKGCSKTCETCEFFKDVEE
jgi:hypothetical protein